MVEGVIVHPAENLAGRIGEAAPVGQHLLQGVAFAESQEGRAGLRMGLHEMARGSSGRDVSVPVSHVFALKPAVLLRPHTQSRKGRCLPRGRVVGTEV